MADIHLSYFNKYARFEYLMLIASAGFYLFSDNETDQVCHVFHTFIYSFNII